MKMVLAIINYDDAQDVISSLMKAGFSITKLATTGGFLHDQRGANLGDLLRAILLQRVLVHPRLRLHHAVRHVLGP